MKPAQSVVEFLGTPVIALLLSTICAMLFLGLPGGFSIKEITNVMTNSLHSCGNIILLISDGGMLRFILQNSGIGELFGNFVGGLPLPMVLVAFLVAAVVYTGSKRTGRINEKRARIKSGEILFNIPCVMRALFYRHVFERSC